MTERAFVGLGSNVGNRLLFLRRATAMLAEVHEVSVVRCSSIFETEPVGFKKQPPFLNAVVEVRATLEPRSLLALLKQIEHRIGRTESVRWGPREIDLDLLLYGSQILRTDDYSIPHAELPRRRFVLVPLAEIAPDVVEPVSGLSAHELLARCPDTSAVVRTHFSLTDANME